MRVKLLCFLVELLSIVQWLENQVFNKSGPQAFPELVRVSLYHET